MSNDISIDIDNPDGDGKFTSVASPALSLLQDAKKYGILLSDLENVNAATPQAELPKQQKKKHKEKYFWQDLDVNLNDIVNLVMNSSERPIIMVSDDKAVYFNFTAMQMLDIKEMKSYYDFIAQCSVR